LLDAPPVNALGLSTIEALIAILNACAKDDAVRAVVLGSAVPGQFCAGLNLKELHPVDPPRVRKLLKTLYVELTDAHFSLGKPCIAAIGGAARGAGMTLGISCDVIIAGEQASFAYPEVNVGLIPAIHFVHLPRIVGRHNAFELLFTGRTFDATEAKQLGLVNRIVAEGEELPAARALAAVLAGKSASVMQLGKAAFMAEIDRDYRAGVARAVEAFCAVADTDDAREGVAAFAQKRKPVWG
jgi:enoyl-CoA hydratase/carnithine racemase